MGCKRYLELYACVNSEHQVRPVYLGPVVQSVVSLTSLLVVKMSTAVVSIISNSQICKSYSHFFSKNISIFAVLMIKVLTIMTNDIISFERLGPGYCAVSS